MEKKVDLSIILPIFNPPAGWECSLIDSIERLFSFFHNLELKIIVVNDGSSNDISEGVRTLQYAFPQVEYLSYAKNQGKGFAIRTGMKQAVSDYYIYTDWDFPFGEEAVYKAYQQWQQHQVDLLIGVRSRSYFASLPLLRKVISQGLRVLNFFVLKFNYVDTQAGIKGVSNQARIIFLANKTNSFIFELEFIRDCFRRNLSIGYLPVSHKKDITFSNFGMKTISRELTVLMRIVLT